MYPRCVASEQTVAPIISKCQEDMRQCLDKLDVVAELASVVERYKTGGVPPTEIQFDDLSLEVLIPSEPIQLSIQSESGVFLYQEKRKLEKKIKQQEEEIERGEREILGLTKMINTYKANPKFGCADQLCEQLEMSAQRVEILRSGVQLLQGELGRVLSRLEIIKMSNETYYYSNYSNYTSCSGHSRDRPGSRASEAEYESLDKLGLPAQPAQPAQPARTNKRDNIFYGYCGQELGLADEKQAHSLGEIESYTNKVYDWITDCAKSPSPPPPPLPSEPPIQLLSRVVALYPFQGEVENSLRVEGGEELLVTEPDIEGWTRVRRLDSDSKDDMTDPSKEGFVPSSFIKFIA